MQSYNSVIEYCKSTKLYVAYIPGFTGAHTQAETLDELKDNLKEVVEMLLEDGIPDIDSEVIGTNILTIA